MSSGWPICATNRWMGVSKTDAAEGRFEGAQDGPDLLELDIELARAVAGDDPLEQFGGRDPGRSPRREEAT